MEWHQFTSHDRRIIQIALKSSGSGTGLTFHYRGRCLWGLSTSSRLQWDIPRYLVVLTSIKLLKLQHRPLLNPVYTPLLTSDWQQITTSKVGSQGMATKYPWESLTNFLYAPFRDSRILIGWGDFSDYLALRFPNITKSGFPRFPTTSTLLSSIGIFSVIVQRSPICCTSNSVAFPTETANSTIYILAIHISPVQTCASPFLFISLYMADSLQTAFVCKSACYGDKD